MLQGFYDLNSVEFSTLKNIKKKVLTYQILVERLRKKRKGSGSCRIKKKLLSQQSPDCFMNGAWNRIQKMKAGRASLLFSFTDAGTRKEAE